MARLIDGKIDGEKLLQSVIEASCGAAVLFVGTTRQFTGDHETSLLVYEAYPEMALAELQKLEAEACAEFPIGRCVIEHRLGAVPIGEISVAVAVSSPHRGAAFAAAQWVMDKLKAQVPIWKKDISPRGERWTPNAENAHRSGVSDAC